MRINNQTSPTQMVARSSLTRRGRKKVSTRIWELAIVQDSLPWAEGSDEMYSVDSGTPGVDPFDGGCSFHPDQQPSFFAASTDIKVEIGRYLAGLGACYSTIKVCLVQFVGLYVYTCTPELSDLTVHAPRMRVTNPSLHSVRQPGTGHSYALIEPGVIILRALKRAISEGLRGRFLGTYNQSEKENE